MSSDPVRILSIDIVNSAITSMFTFQEGDANNLSVITRMFVDPSDVTNMFFGGSTIKSGVNYGFIGYMTTSALNLQWVRSWTDVTGLIGHRVNDFETSGNLIFGTSTDLAILQTQTYANSARTFLFKMSYETLSSTFVWRYTIEDGTNFCSILQIELY